MSLVFTYEISPRISISTSYIFACSLFVLGHADSIFHGFCGVQDVLGPFSRLPHCPDETSFGVLVVIVPFIAALPFFAVIESMKSVLAPIAPVLFTIVFTVQA